MIAKKVTIIGAGNVGHHLAKRFHECGHIICQIFSRSLTKANKLASLTNSQGINQLSKLNFDADVYIIATKDDSMKTLAEEIYFLNKENKTIAHTSGTVASTEFSQFNNYGVFYPLQTFSVHTEVDFEKLPFCIYGNTTNTETQLKELAESICPNVYLVNDQQRATLHVTAVIVNNFSNYLYGIADAICAEQNLSFDILKPLIQETSKKINQSSPLAVQTGPAARKDYKTIEKHLNFLDKFPKYQKVYKLLSNEIIDWTK